MNPLSRPVPRHDRAKNSQHPGLDLGAGVPLFQLLVGQFQQLPSLTGPCRIPGDSQGLLQDLPQTELCGSPQFSDSQGSSLSCLEIVAVQILDQLPDPRGISGPDWRQPILKDRKDRSRIPFGGQRLDGLVGARRIFRS